MHCQGGELRGEADVDVKMAADMEIFFDGDLVETAFNDILLDCKKNMSRIG